MLRAPRDCRLLSSAALAAAAGVAVGLALTWSSETRAEMVDPTMPRTVSVGPPRGAAPSERFDPARTGRARTRLPAVPVETWRRHVSGNIDVSPIVDAEGNVIVALTIPEILKLGPDARELWRARLGNAAPLAPPTLLSDGTIAVVTAAGIAWGFTPSGATRFSTPLGVARRDADAAPLALDDGGLLIAAGNQLVEIDSDGAIRTRTSLDEQAGERATGGVIDSADGPLITTASGHVYRYHAPAPPRRIGSFGGTTARGAFRADERTLLAVVDGRRLVALDLPTGVAHVRVSGVPLDGLGALDASGLVLVATQLGLLLGVDAAGNERVHVSLEKPVPLLQGLTLASLAAPVELHPSPPVVVDPLGRVAFVRASGRAGVVSPGGRVEIAADPVCAAPIAVLPAGDKRMLIACHDGRLWMYGE